VTGFILGLTIDFLIDKRKNRQKSPNKVAEVVVFVACEETNVELIRNILLKHFALGIAEVN
jgi:NADPH-dependent ferric siderophore reductase